MKSAESRADEYESEKAELEQDSTELRQRAATLSDELEKVKAESSIKISEYKRSASQGMDTSNEIYQKQLADKEVELETIQVKYNSFINRPKFCPESGWCTCTSVAKVRLIVVIPSHLRQRNSKMRRNYVVLNFMLFSCDS